MSSGDEEGDVHPVMQSKTVSHIVDFRPEVTDVEANEYSFMGSIQTNNNKLITQIWAGPSHWKLKYVRPASKSKNLKKDCRLYYLFFNSW